MHCSHIPTSFIYDKGFESYESYETLSTLLGKQRLWDVTEVRTHFLLHTSFLFLFPHDCPGVRICFPSQSSYPTTP